jgi:hypothetical protein
MLVVFERFKAQQRKLESILAVTRLGMASPRIATRLGQNGQHFVNHAHRVYRLHLSVGFRSKSVAQGKVRQSKDKQAERSHGELQQATGG